MLKNSYYLFVEVASQRCSQLMRGAKPKIDLRAHKYSTIACAEVKENLIPWRTVTDEQLAAELAAGLAAQQAAGEEGTHADLALAGATPPKAKEEKG
ncbi:MAG: DNA-directed RNA polymerase subunit omega [Acidobacteria bacterium]|nr:DNA-directed RNA polymerase subunit omega [Acidobacteriota bacterium]